MNYYANVSVVLSFLSIYLFNKEMTHAPTRLLEVNADFHVPGKMVVLPPLEGRHPTPYEARYDETQGYASLSRCTALRGILDAWLLGIEKLISNDTSLSPLLSEEHEKIDNFLGLSISVFGVTHLYFSATNLKILHKTTSP